MNTQQAKQDEYTNILTDLDANFDEAKNRASTREAAMQLIVARAYLCAAAIVPLTVDKDLARVVCRTYRVWDDEVDFGHLCWSFVIHTLKENCQADQEIFNIISRCGFDVCAYDLFEENLVFTAARNNINLQGLEDLMYILREIAYKVDFHWRILFDRD